MLICFRYTGLLKYVINLTCFTFHVTTRKFKIIQATYNVFLLNTASPYRELKHNFGQKTIVK